MAESHIAGCILGTAIGDALGLPYEGVSPRRARRLLGPPDRHRFLQRHGMVSDDTEHTCMVAQSLIASGGEVDFFRREFARRLRWWLLALPAGIGRATLRASLRLWLGVSPLNSGVFSTGNGPAMRAALFGAALDDVDQIVALVTASSRITHSDPKAMFGAIAVALAAYMARCDAKVGPREYANRVANIVGPEANELTILLQSVAESVLSGQSTPGFAAQIGLSRGVTGYTYHTVPVALHAWLSYPHDFRRGVETVIKCGGDADTTAAIVGGIVGTSTGERGIPTEWVRSVAEWPRTIGWMRNLARRLHESRNDSAIQTPPQLNLAAVLARNILFLAVVLVHVLRRLLPPYR